MNRKYYLPSLLLLGAIVISACAKAATPEVVEEVAVVDPTACNVPVPDSPVTITYFGWPFEIMEFYAAEMEKCGEIENIDVDVQFLDFVAVGEQVDLALSGGGESPYDILHMSNVEMANNSNNGWLYPLNDLIDKYRDQYDLDDIAAASFQGATVDGKIYGIPAINNTLHLAYRSDLFDKYGIDVPVNYDEVIAACEVLADEPSIDYPFTMDLSADWAWEIEFFAFVRGYGSDYLNDDLTPAFNGPEGVAGLTKMKEVVDACMGPEGLAGSPYETAEVNLNNGGQAFIHVWASNTVSMFDPEQSDFADVIKFAPAAAPKPGGLLGGSAWTDYYGIPATTTNDPELVFLVIMEALDRESMERGADLGAVTRTSITKGLPNKPALSETVANGVGIYDTHPAVALAQAALWKFLPFVGTGEMTPQEALDAAAEDYIAEATAQGYLP
ncbi:MAG: ABC transporter substrate-binding protein [Anaerolineales bacterium]